MARSFHTRKHSQFAVMMKRKQTSIDLSTKLKIIEEIEKGTKFKSVIAKEFGIPKSTLSTILKNKEKLYQAIAAGTVTPTQKTKRMRLAKHEDVEAELFTWFKSVRSANLPISGPIIQEKAEKIAENLGVTDFKCSSGWLHRFKNRHNIGSIEICGESNKVNESDANEWITYLNDVKKSFSARDIYNFDESGIFYNLLPERTLSIKGEKCHGGTKSKQRLTAVFLCNSDGSEKVRVWIIGKWANPRCFKGINRLKLPCQYSHQRNAWIDEIAFRQWLIQFDSRMRVENRHVLLTLDNCSAHSIGSLKLTNVKVIFFPANMTSRLQPLDQGIISIVKKKYRKNLLRHAVQAFESKTPLKSLNVLQAIRFIALAWESVSAEHIKKCFNKAWTRSDTEIPLQVDIHESEE